MLERMRQTLPDLVWLRDSKQKTALQVTGWRREAAPRTLSFYAPQFYRHDSQNPWLCGEAVPWPEFEPLAIPKVLRLSAPKQESFAAIHAEILRGIEEQRFQKVVPFAGEELEFAGALRWPMFPATLADPVDQIAFGFQQHHDGMCGITPELLFRVKDGVLSTMALAGTGVIGGPSLMIDPKEMLEHKLVIEDICHSLRGLGGINVGFTREQNYTHLKHLLTPIEVTLNEPPAFLDLIARLHPTAALGGLPRAAALDFLRLRGGERHRFGAPFGWVNGDEMFCVVAIRCLQWSGALAWLMSGCGVVVGSVAEREWRELQLKREATARQLGLIYSVVQDGVNGIRDTGISEVYE